MVFYLVQSWSDFGIWVVDDIQHVLDTEVRHSDRSDFAHLAQVFQCSPLFSSSLSREVSSVKIIREMDQDQVSILDSKILHALLSLDEGLIEGSPSTDLSGNPIFRSFQAAFFQCLTETLAVRIEMS